MNLRLEFIYPNLSMNRIVSSLGQINLFNSYQFFNNYIVLRFNWYLNLEIFETELVRFKVLPIWESGHKQLPIFLYNQSFSEFWIMNLKLLWNKHKIYLHKNYYNTYR